MLRSTEEFRCLFEAARRVGTPLVAIRTADPASALAQASAASNASDVQTPLVAWDFVGGLLGRNEPGKSAVAKIIGENASLLGPGDVLSVLPRIAADAIVFFLNPQRVWEQVDVVQGIWNPRDLFKAGGQDGDRTTIREYVRGHWPHARVLSTTEFGRSTEQYNFALCANVLPVIPNPRVRSSALRSIAGRLAPGGSCLFVVQYRNSYFRSIPFFDGAKRHLDGWLVRRDRLASSYFGILPRAQLEDLVAQQGFTVVRSWVNEQSAYVLCTMRREILKGA